MSGMGEPDQIDMMDERELRLELRGVLVDMGRMAEDNATLQSRLDTAERSYTAAMNAAIENGAKLQEMQRWANEAFAERDALRLKLDNETTLRQNAEVARRQSESRLEDHQKLAREGVELLGRMADEIITDKNEITFTGVDSWLDRAGCAARGQPFWVKDAKVNCTDCLADLTAGQNHLEGCSALSPRIVENRVPETTATKDYADFRNESE